MAEVIELKKENDILCECGLNQWVVKTDNTGFISSMTCCDCSYVVSFEDEEEDSITFDLGV